ncbi:MAG: PQQ-binding-like beta-propeller repeat protein [Candidatus Cybelea sp.]
MPLLLGRRAYLAALATLWLAACAGPPADSTVPVTKSIPAAAIPTPLARLQALANASTANWPQSFYDAAHTGFNRKETILSPANVSGLQQLWGMSVPGGITGFALGRGKIFAQGQGSTNTPNLVAFDAQTGAQLWSIVTGSDGYYLSGTVAFAKGLVFAGCALPESGGGHVGGVCAYSESTGQQVWGDGLGCSCSPDGSLAAPLVYSNGVIYVGLAGGYHNRGSSGIYALNATTGSVLWADTGIGFGGMALAVGGGNVYDNCQGNNFDGICALSQSTGAPQWSYNDVTGVPFHDVTFAGGMVYVHAQGAQSGGTSTVIALNAATGATQWSFTDSGGGGGGPVAISKGTLYFTGFKNSLTALKARTGSMLWSNGGADAFSAPSIANGVLYVTGGAYCGGGCSNSASAYSTAAGTVLWHAPNYSSTLNPPPLVVDGKLYVGSASTCAPCAFALTARQRGVKALRDSVR